VWGGSVVGAGALERFKKKNHTSDIRAERAVVGGGIEKEGSRVGGDRQGGPTAAKPGRVH